MISSPAIAILAADTLASIGLAGIINRMMPAAEVRTYATFDELKADDHGQFFHYFVTSQLLLAHAAYFLARSHKTIVLLHGDESALLPQGFHTLNVTRSEADLVRDFLHLARAAHGAPGSEPEVVRRAQHEPADAPVPVLTPRETEVLRLLVTGLINKEIADRLGVGLATVITHRKNIAEKLGTKSLSAMTIYAVSHGLVKAEEI